MYLPMSLQGKGIINKYLFYKHLFQINEHR
jgi:hypothetical protein